MGELMTCYSEPPADLPTPLNGTFHLYPKNDKDGTRVKMWYQTWDRRDPPLVSIPPYSMAGLPKRHLQGEKIIDGSVKNHAGRLT